MNLKLIWTILRELEEKMGAGRGEWVGGTGTKEKETWTKGIENWGCEGRGRLGNDWQGRIL